jgi:hypothetical protein
MASIPGDSVPDTDMIVSEADGTGNFCLFNALHIVIRGHGFTPGVAVPPVTKNSVMMNVFHRALDGVREFAERYDGGMDVFFHRLMDGDRVVGPTYDRLRRGGLSAFDAYKQALLEVGYGGHLELEAIARAYDLQILVYTLENGTYRRTNRINPDAQRFVCLRRSGGRQELGAHYDALFYSPGGNDVHSVEDLDELPVQGHEEPAVVGGGRTRPRGRRYDAPEPCPVTSDQVETVRRRMSRGHVCKVPVTYGLRAPVGPGYAQPWVGDLGNPPTGESPVFGAPLASIDPRGTTVVKVADDGFGVFLRSVRGRGITTEPMEAAEASIRKSPGGHTRLPTLSTGSSPGWALWTSLMQGSTSI